MNVTIYSDASLCPETEVVGWGGWVKSDRGTLYLAGKLKNKTRDTNIAEAMAAVNSLAIAIKKNIVNSDDFIILNTDNNNVMEILQGKAKRKTSRRIARRKNRPIAQLREEAVTSNEMIKRISEIYKALITEQSLQVKWNHVKGHCGKKDKRTAINHGCDQRAKREMKKARSTQGAASKNEKNNKRTRRRKRRNNLRKKFIS